MSVTTPEGGDSGTSVDTLPPTDTSPDTTAPAGDQTSPVDPNNPASSSTPADSSGSSTSDDSNNQTGDPGAPTSPPDSGTTPPDSGTTTPPDSGTTTPPDSGTTTPGGGSPATGSVTTALFHNADEINQWWTSTTGKNFVDWFNATQSGKGPWDGVKVSASGGGGFNALWNNIQVVFGKDSVGVAEVLVLTSVVLNETGGTFKPIAELMGYQGHPGISYAFDSFKLPLYQKASYNVAPWTAFDSFNNADFLNAHGSKPLADKVSKTTDAVWKGQTYPQGSFPTDVSPSVSGIILEADFYKFRGRGLIQTTFRRGYRPIVQFIQSYSGSQSVVSSYASQWTGKDPDLACHISSNTDWDALFMTSDLVVPCAAISLHNKAGKNYLAVASDRATLAGQSTGSAYLAGRTVNPPGVSRDFLV